MRSSEIRDLLRLVERPEVISLAGGLPEPGGFPVAALAAAATDLLVPGPGAVAALQYSTTDGDEALRGWIAARHERSTGRVTTADEVLLTTGSQQGLDLLGRILADPGDRAIVENPGYLGALQALRAARLALEGVDVDAEGLRVEELEARLVRGTRPRLVYTVPTFQNPTGSSLPDERRRALGRLADRFGFVVVEDAPYEALRFRGDPIAPVATHSPQVVSLGSFSKTLAPGLRLGWMVGPPDLVAAAARAKQAVDLHTSGLSQHLTLRLVDRAGWFDDHVADLTVLYSERCATLRAALDERLGDRYRFTDPDGGMFLWGSPRSGAPEVDATALLPLALENGTAFVPGAAFAVGDAAAHRLRASMRLSFATATPERLVEAVDRLARALDAALAPA